MSGHSKWATTHRQKEIKDAARGQLFSKFAKLITIAAKTGGGPNIDTNFRLRDIIEKAKAANMPKDNIDRAVSKASGGGEELVEVVYEVFGPNGVAVMIESTTDNRNRTSQEIKNLVERNGGTFAGPGAVSFQFDHVGLLLVEKQADVDSQTLQLIDLGVIDLNITSDGVECYVPTHDLYSKRKEIENAGFKVLNSELIMKPKVVQQLTDTNQIEKTINFLEIIEEHDDVNKVFTNAGFPD